MHIEDCGPKGGLNGVDNGRLAFTDVRVPRDSLLNRYGDVAADGTYSTPIASTNARFFTMLGTLDPGPDQHRRRLGERRPGRTGHRRPLRRAAAPVRVPRTRRRGAVARLPQSSAPVVAAAGHVVRAAGSPRKTSSATLHEVFTTDGATDAQRRELETRAAGIKAISTWHATAAIQTAREACGGAGYLAENLLPGLKADTDIFTTFEGDNTVLLQLVAKELLTRYRTSFGELDPLGVLRFAGPPRPVDDGRTHRGPRTGPTAPRAGTGSRR